MAVVIRRFTHTSVDYQHALALRNEVLRKPLGLQFTEAELKKDEDDLHWGLFLDNNIIACLTLTVVDNIKVKMRQVAVDRSKQGNGYGRKLSAMAEKFATENGFEFVYCHARKSAVGFYESMGYKIVSDIFVEVSIPHVVMQKRLK